MVFFQSLRSTLNTFSLFFLKITVDCRLRTRYSYKIKSLFAIKTYDFSNFTFKNITTRFSWKRNNFVQRRRIVLPQKYEGSTQVINKSLYVTSQTKFFIILHFSTDLTIKFLHLNLSYIRLTKNLIEFNRKSLRTNARTHLHCNYKECQR